MIDYSVDAAGIATISWDMPDRSMNVMNEESMAAFNAAVDRAVADDAVKGVIVTSGKKDFLAGADLGMMLKTMPKDAAGIFAFVQQLQQQFRDIETCGKPFAAALNGTALGGGYELALACHYRVAADNARALFGLPEVQVGLLPGGGGTQRLLRMIGIREALPLLLEGRKVDPGKALSLGMIDKVVPADELLAEARRWLLEEGAKNAVKPWDVKKFRVPGGTPMTPKGLETFTAGNAMLREKTYGNYPAPIAIMSCVYEGSMVDIDAGLRIEARYFTSLLTGDVAKNMIRTLFFSMGEANKLGRRPAGVPPTEYRKVGVLGAGMMGAGIAHVAALAGLEVVLLDTTLEAAGKGKGYSEGLLAKRVSRRRMSVEGKAAVLGRIHPTTAYEDLAGCDIVIEAVFEDRAIKADVTARAEAAMPETAVFASNTSTLPITGLAEASSRPENFIGLHFFSPVDRMPLVEIIRGGKTSDACLARAMDFVRAIRKTPIVVNDSRGFFTSRVFATYVTEGIAMLAEGVNPALIDNAGRMAGMPVGPLALADEVSIDLMHKVRKQTMADLGDAYRPSPADPVVDRFVETLGRIGRKAGKGFYDYPAEGKKRLWPGLAEQFPVSADQPSADEVIRRLMHIQGVETARCLEEGVITDPRDADVGSILGWGFAPHYGGVMSMIHTIGIDDFVAECDRLAQAHGPRFAPPASLRAMADRGETLYAA